MSEFRAAMDEAAYKALSTTHPRVLDALKELMRGGSTAQQIEMRYRSDSKLTSLSIICAAYHLESHPELLQEGNKQT
jgi:hypothetical protein